MITIKNTQRRIALDISAIRKTVSMLLDALNYPDFDIGIWFTTNASIQKYNKLYRHKDKPTDILSFPFYPDLVAGKRINAKTNEEKNLGDLIISPEYVQKDCGRFSVSFQDRMDQLLVHGMCHLLGYDHIEDADYKKMHKKELFLLKKIKTS